MKENQLRGSTPSPNPSNVAYLTEQLRKEVIQELEGIESRLRVKGDFWRAEQVKKFRIEYFGELEGS